MTATDGTAEIPLTQGQVALVDYDDYERVSAFKWHAVKDGNTFYARTKIGQNYSPTSMHRFILDLTPDDLEVDHINRNGLDNRRSNLRLATRSENARNRAALGYTIDGAGFRKKPYKVSKNGKYVGRFASVEEAQEAYRNA